MHGRAQSESHAPLGCTVGVPQVDAFPGELVFFIRVLNLLRGRPPVTGRKSQVPRCESQLTCCRPLVTGCCTSAAPGHAFPSAFSPCGRAFPSALSSLSRAALRFSGLSSGLGARVAYLDVMRPFAEAALSRYATSTMTQWQPQV